MIGPGSVILLSMKARCGKCLGRQQFFLELMLFSSALWLSMQFRSSEPTEEICSSNCRFGSIITRVCVTEDENHCA